MPPRYKFVEVSPVTDQTLEAAVNEWVAQGWHLEAIRFVVTEHSARPRLAFVSFVTELGPALAAPPDRLGRPVNGATEEVASEPVPPPPRARPLVAPDEGARVITAAHGDDVE